MINKWNKLPVAVRWILLFPTVVIAEILIGLVSRVLILSGGFPAQVFELLFPPFMALVGLFIAFHLAPNGKFILLIILICIRSLFILVFVTGAIFRCLGADIEMSWTEWWRPFIGEILTLICSIWLYKYLKEEYAEPEVGEVSSESALSDDSQPNRYEKKINKK